MVIFLDVIRNIVFRAIKLFSSFINVIEKVLIWASYVVQMVMTSPFSIGREIEFDDGTLATIIDSENIKKKTIFKE